MVCDRAVLKSNGQMVFFGGLLTGSLLTGMISDRYTNHLRKHAFSNILKILQPKKKGKISDKKYWYYHILKT